MTRRRIAGGPPLLAIGCLALVSPLARAETIWVSMPPSAAPCDFAQLAADIGFARPSATLRRGEAPVAPEGNPGEVHVHFERAGDAWSLWLLADSETTQRALPPAGTDCVALSQTAAFMIERYLARLGPEGPDPAALDSNAPVIAPRSPPSLVTERAPLRSPAASPPISPDHTLEATATPAVKPSITAPATNRWQGLVGASVNGGFGTVVSPAFALDMGVRRGPWQAGVGLETFLPAEISSSDDAPLQGRFRLQSILAELTAGHRIGLGLGSLQVDLAPGVALDWASVSAGEAVSVFFTARPYAGARIGWEVPLSSRLALGLRLEARFFLAGGDPDDDGDTNLANFMTDGALSLSYELF